MAIKLTENALKELKRRMKLIEHDPNNNLIYLRMGVRGGGCSGLSYLLEFDTEKTEHDKLFEIEGIRVVVDPKSYLYLNGATLDYVTRGLTGGFTFINPNAQSSCGCGSSFRPPESPKKDEESDS